MISKALGVGALIAVLIAGFLLWSTVREDAAEQRGIDRQVAADVAKANQAIAERRVTDAKFDRLDARDLCLKSDLEWVFEDGKSFCR